VPLAEAWNGLLVAPEAHERAAEVAVRLGVSRLKPDRLAERCDRGYEAFADCRRNISQPPTHYFKQFYYDTVNFNPDAIEFAITFAGVDHILAGSDYPHQIGSIPKMLTSLQAINVSDDERRLILGGNAARLLGVQ
jgi:aminocarboxymuconate-semialdehyde decarboxylase